MSAVVEAVKPKVIEPQYKLRERLVAATFVESVPFAGENASVRITANGNCDSITPARLEPDGTAVAISTGQRADGLLLRRKRHDTAANVRYVEQCFVPFTNVRGMSYGE